MTSEVTGEVLSPGSTCDTPTVFPPGPDFSGPSGMSRKDRPTYRQAACPSSRPDLRRAPAPT